MTRPDGEKAPRVLALIPGMDGVGALFDPVMEQLKSQGWRVMRVEHCVEEEWLKPDASVVRLARAVAERLDMEGAERAVICGESFGSMAALEFVRRWPGRTAGLVLCSGFGRLPFPARRRLFSGFFPLLAVGAALTPAFVLRLSARLWNPLARRGDPPQLRRAVRQISIPSARCLLAKIRLALEFDARPWPGEIRTPTVIPAGDRDQLIPPRCARELEAGIPGARLTLLPGGHLAHHARPELIGEALREVVSFSRTEER